MLKLKDKARRWTMPGEIRFKYAETEKRFITTQLITDSVPNPNVQVCVTNNGELVLEGGSEICTSTTLSYAITQKQEKR